MAEACANSSRSAPTEPQLSESQVLVQSFLDAYPELGKELGDIEVMTDRYTNLEWAKQIRETQRKVVVIGNEGGSGKGMRRYHAPVPGGKEFAETIDHTVLKLDATSKQIDALCSEARTEGFKSVCVRVNHVVRCVSNLKGTSVVVACVVGFHEGTQDTYSKLSEARAAVAAGASELDIVLNHGILTAQNSTPTSSPPPADRKTVHKRDSTADTITWKNTEANTKPSNGEHKATGPYSESVPGSTSRGSSSHSISSQRTATDNVDESSIPDYSAIFRELASLRSLCPSPTILKLILETSQLTPPQILAAAHLAAAANFDFIKTSTGFNGPGAKLSDVQLMVAAAEYLSVRSKENGGSPVRGGSRKMQVKASGGIRDLNAAVQMLEAGATRLGTSSGLWIMQEARARQEEVETRRPSPVSRLYTDDSISDY